MSTEPEKAAGWLAERRKINDAQPASPDEIANADKFLDSEYGKLPSAYSYDTFLKILYVAHSKFSPAAVITSFLSNKNPQYAKAIAERAYDVINDVVGELTPSAWLLVARKFGHDPRYLKNRKRTKETVAYALYNNVFRALPDSFELDEWTVMGIEANRQFAVHQRDKSPETSSSVSSDSDSDEPTEDPEIVEIYTPITPSSESSSSAPLPPTAAVVEPAQKQQQSVISITPPVVQQSAPTQPTVTVPVVQSSTSSIKSDDDDDDTVPPTVVQPTSQPQPASEEQAPIELKTPDKFKGVKYTPTIKEQEPAQSDASKHEEHEHKHRHKHKHGHGHKHGHKHKQHTQHTDTYKKMEEAMEDVHKPKNMRRAAEQASAVDRQHMLKKLANAKERKDDRLILAVLMADQSDWKMDGAYLNKLKAKFPEGSRVHAWLTKHINKENVAEPEWKTVIAGAWTEAAKKRRKSPAATTGQIVPPQPAQATSSSAPVVVTPVPAGSQPPPLFQNAELSEITAYVSKIVEGTLKTLHANMLHYNALKVVIVQAGDLYPIDRVIIAILSDISILVGVDPTKETRLANASLVQSILNTMGTGTLLTVDDWRRVREAVGTKADYSWDDREVLISETLQHLAHEEAGESSEYESSDDDTAPIPLDTSSSSSASVAEDVKMKDKEMTATTGVVTTQAATVKDVTMSEPTQSSSTSSSSSAPEVTYSLTKIMPATIEQIDKLLKSMFNERFTSGDTKIESMWLHSDEIVRTILMLSVIYPMPHVVATIIDSYHVAWYVNDTQKLARDAGIYTELYEAVKMLVNHHMLSSAELKAIASICRRCDLEGNCFGKELEKWAASAPSIVPRQKFNYRPLGYIDEIYNKVRTDWRAQASKFISASANSQLSKHMFLHLFETTPGIQMYIVRAMIDIMSNDNAFSIDQYDESAATVLRALSRAIDEISKTVPMAASDWAYISTVASDKIDDYEEDENVTSMNDAIRLGHLLVVDNTMLLRSIRLGILGRLLPTQTTISANEFRKEVSDIFDEQYAEDEESPSEDIRSKRTPRGVELLLLDMFELFAHRGDVPMRMIVRTLIDVAVNGLAPKRDSVDDEDDDVDAQFDGAMRFLEDITGTALFDDDLHDIALASTDIEDEQHSKEFVEQIESLQLFLDRGKYSGKPSSHQIKRPTQEFDVTAYHRRHRISPVCAVCGEAATKWCSGCGKVYYCGVEHQTQHWPTHKHECY
jgi:hypothetical protein